MDFRQYIGKPILAWLWYDPEYYNPDKANTVCYIYPRILVNKTNCDPIDPQDFPKHGGIRVNIYGGDSAEDIYEKFGSLVSIKINKDSYPDYEGNNMYTLKYNSQFGKANSEIWIESFSGKGFYQVIDVNSDIATLKNDRSIPEPDCKVCTTLVLLRCDSKLYGPFEYDTKEGIMMLRGIKDYQYTIGEYSAVDYNDEMLVVDDQNNDEAVIIIPKSVLVSPEEVEARFDWISEETLIANFIESLRVENNYTRDQVRQLKEMAHQLIERTANVQFTEERILKIQSLVNGISQNEEYAQEILQFALSDESTKEVLVKELVSNHFDQVQDRVLEFSEVQDRLLDLKAQEASLLQHIQALQFDAENTRRTTSEADQNKIDTLERTIDELQKENDDLTAIIGVQKEIETLKAECDSLKRDRDRAKESYNQQLLDNKELEKQFNSTLDTFKDEAKKISRVIDSKLLDKILRGLGEEPVIEDIAPFDSSLLHSVPMNYSDIIDRVTTFITDKAHRDVTTNDVANYLICISQGFITTFAGEPGTGKTSLCNILAKALGLVADASQKRFVDISVERGWSSHKDFIGYYNPLTKSMEKSNMEVFNAFSKMDKEYGCDESKIAPFIILLDEANLSPLEHYWAAFLRNCDFTSVSNRSISLGGNNCFKLPEHLRFLATVNFDHTTEELSPRFLDRSWVIMLEPSRIDDEADEDIENIENMVSFGAMKEAFCVGENDVIDEAIQNKWNAIQKIFRERSLQIMPRNLKMVKNYCAVGCRCMERDTPTTKLAPLDYAFSQKILPTINGSGENYRMLIEDLMKECTAQNMPISAKHLERIKRVSENNMGFYQFFSH